MGRKSISVANLAVISRAEAKSQGLKRFFTGRPCSRGHINERLTSNSGCCQCNRDKVLAKYRENHDQELRVRAEKRKDPAVKAAAKLYAEAYRATPEAREAARQTHRRRYEADEAYALASRVRKLVSGSFERMGMKKAARTEEILGCTITFFREHMERQFLPGMGWHNRTEWEIDHIVPLSMARTLDEVAVLNRFTNLRPLWRLDNRLKGAQEHFLL